MGASWSWLIRNSQLQRPFPLLKLPSHIFLNPDRGGRAAIALQNKRRKRRRPL
jgi:hypothetical protein